MVVRLLGLVARLLFLSQRESLRRVFASRLWWGRDERAEKDWCYVDGWLWTDVAVCRDTIVSGSFRTRSVGGGYEALAVAFYDDGSVKSEEMIYYEHPMVDVGTYGHCSYYYESGFLKDSNGVLQCKELYGGSGELVEVVEYKDGTNDLCRREAQRG